MTPPRIGVVLSCPNPVLPLPPAAAALARLIAASLGRRTAYVNAIPPSSRPGG